MRALSLAGKQQAAVKTLHVLTWGIFTSTAHASTAGKTCTPEAQGEHALEEGTLQDMEQLFESEKCLMVFVKFQKHKLDDIRSWNEKTMNWNDKNCFR